MLNEGLVVYKLLSELFVENFRMNICIDSSLHSSKKEVCVVHLVILVGSLQSLDWNGGMEWWNRKFGRN